MNIQVFHKTDYRSALSILQNGFDLNKFGHATKKSGQGAGFSFHPKGIYFSVDYGQDPERLLDHPWNHKDRGVLVFCSINLDNPLLVQLRINGIFYQEYISNQYGGKKGAELTKLIQKDGYDGIYCEESGEVVVFDENKIIINKEKTKISIMSYKQFGFKEWLDYFFGI